MFEKFEIYHLAQAWLSKNQELHRGSRQEALEIITKKIAEVVEVDQVGIWFFTIAKEAIYEDVTFRINKGFNKGTVLHKKDLPLYFARINEEKITFSNNVATDTGVNELFNTHFKSHNILASLDAPIFSDGDLIGILRIDQIGKTREWDLMDKNFASIASDFIGRITEAEKRHTYEKELRHRINFLESDLRKKLDDLNEAKLSLDLALEGAQAGKWDWDIPSGRLSLNRTWYTKLGYDFNELPQNLETFKSVIYPEDVEKVFEELNRHIAGKTIFYEARYRMITKSGEVQWVLDRGCIAYRASDGTPIRAIGVNINVTPIIKFEQSLILSEQQLKYMIQSLPTSVAMFDRNFNYVAFSSRWKMEWDKFNDPKSPHKHINGMDEFKKHWIVKMQEALSGKTLSADEDLVEFFPGMEIWLRWVIQPWRNANEEIGGVIVMVENITARKEGEIKLTQASKLSALGEMAGGIAHEINNPLSIIKGYIDLLKRLSTRKSLKEDVLLQYIEKMDSTVGRISKIVNGMRRFSRESSMDEKVEYSLNKIIEETLDICQERINNNGIVVETQYLPDQAYILCRPVEISQVLLNLVNNSYQAIASQQRPLIKIICTETEKLYRIQITDSGDGIPPSVRQKLFQPFFTTKDVGVGTGLGLSISRGIIEEHEGKLYYQEESPNTTFVIELPKINLAIQTLYNS